MKAADRVPKVILSLLVASDMNYAGLRECRKGTQLGTLSQAD